MRFMRYPCTIICLAATVLATSICTPENRIEGVKLGVQAVVTGNDAIRAKVPFGPHATFVAHVYEIPIPIGVGQLGSRMALRFLHSIITDANFTYRDDGNSLATANGTVQITWPGFLDVLDTDDVPATVEASYDDRACQIGKVSAYFSPLHGSSKLVDFFKGLLGQKD